VTECVSDGINACCMAWCIVGLNDCSSPFDTCTGLAPAVYVNGTEYGVCWDGFPC
jgi:hypothetical protein